MALDNTFQPPVNYPIRPLNKGMVRNLPSNGLPQGSFLRLQNYRVHEYGLKRRGGLVPFNLNNGTGETATYDEQLLDLIYYWSSAANPEMLLLGAKNLMAITSNGIVSKVYPNGPDNQFLLGSIGAYNSATYTIQLVFPCTSTESERMYVGSKVFFEDTDDSNTIKYFGEVVSSSYSSPDITLEVDVGITDPSVKPVAATDDIIVRETFISSDKMDVSFGVFPAESYEDQGKVIFADQGDNGLYVYDSGTLSTFVTDSGVISGEGTQYLDSARVITYFEDRAFVGNTLEQGIRFPQRIRWSDPITYDRFQPGNYVDLPYGDGELLNLVPLGPLLVAYYSDAIFIGRPTNIAGRPYKFERMETGTMGLINQRAIIPWDDGHYFVGTDNIYFIGMDQGKQAIGSPVLEETLEYSKFLQQGDNIQVQHDPRTESIVFLFPDVVEDSIDSKSIATKLWRLNYKTMGWSYDEVYFNDTEKSDPAFYYTGLLPSRYYTSGMDWENWQNSEDEFTEVGTKSWMPVKSDDSLYAGTPTTENPGTTITDPATDIADSVVALEDTFWSFLTWDNLKSEGILSKKLYLPIWRRNGGSQLIVEEGENMEQDNLGETAAIDNTEILYPVWTVVESMDFDFGLPDTSKTVTRFGCKIFDNQLSELRDQVKTVLSELTFSLYMSDRMGYKWKRPITFGFKDNYNEGFANFRATGSTFRFKLISNQDVPPYKLSEMTLRVVGRGLQVEN